MRCGIKSVTMDDIARELKMSKKTIHKYVNDKSDLVVKVMKANCEMERIATSQMVAANANAIDELIEVTKHVSGKLQQMHPSIHYDLEKYYPEAWKVFADHKKNYILSCMEDNIERGIEQGLYRDNINAKVIARLHVSKIDVIWNAEVFPFPEYQFAEVHAEMMRHHIRGMSSVKGVKYLEQKVKMENLDF